MLLSISSTFSFSLTPFLSRSIFLYPPLSLPRVPQKVRGLGGENFVGLSRLVRLSLVSCSGLDHLELVDCPRLAVLDVSGCRHLDRLRIHDVSSTATAAAINDAAAATADDAAADDAAADDAATSAGNATVAAVASGT